VNGYDPLKLPSESEIRRNIDDLKKQVGDNPAALGLYLRDEPDARTMVGLGKSRRFCMTRRRSR
jgi:hypothetical protein